MITCREGNASGVKGTKRELLKDLYLTKCVNFGVGKKNER